MSYFLYNLIQYLKNQINEVQERALYKKKKKYKKSPILEIFKGDQVVQIFKQIRVYLFNLDSSLLKEGLIGLVCSIVIKKKSVSQN